MCPLAPARGAMTVPSGSSVSIITWDSSTGAFFRTATLGGMRLSTVPSVARMRAALPAS